MIRRLRPLTQSALLARFAGPVALVLVAGLFAACRSESNPAAQPGGPQPTVSAIAGGGRVSNSAPSAGESTPGELLLAALGRTTDLVAHENVAALAAATKFAVGGCPPGASCPASASAGASAFPYVSCAAHFATKDELEGIFGQVFSDRMPQLFAIARTEPSAAADQFPLGPFAAVFETTPPHGVTGATGAILALDETGRILSLRTGCRATPAQLYASLAVLEVLIEPQR